MAWQQPPYAVLTLLSAAVSAGFAVFAVRRRDVPGAVPLAAIMTAAAGWTLTDTFQLASTTLETKLLWANLAYVFVVVLPAAWLVFALEYTGRDEWVTRRTVALLAIEPVAVLAVIATNPAHGLFRASASLERSGGYVALEATPAIGFWLHLAYSYFLLVAGTLLVLEVFVLSEDLYRSQAVALLIGVLAPWTGNVLFVMELTPPGVDPTAVAFIVTGLALSWAVFRHELLDVMPVARELAREELIESMTDPVVVLDGAGRIADCNPAAASLVGDDRSTLLGRPLEEGLPELAAAIEPEGGDEDARTRVRIDRNGVTRHYDARVSSLERGYGTVSGRLIVLRDVTDRDRRRQRLEVLNRVLRHDLRNDMNVLLAHAEDLLEGEGDMDAKARKIREKSLEVAELSDQARQLEHTLSGDDVVLERLDVVRVIERNVASLTRDHPRVSVGTDLPEHAYVYANGLLDSAIENLIENAVEHNDSDTPRVRVTVERGEEFVDVTIADNGPGIPESELAVFERGTETSLEHASGLGLWLINWIVTESGGEIEFAGNEPRGTVVTVRLLPAEPP